MIKVEHLRQLIGTKNSFKHLPSPIFIITAINLYCVTDSKRFRLGFFTVLHNYKIMPYIYEYVYRSARPLTAANKRIRGAHSTEMDCCR